MLQVRLLMLTAGHLINLPRGMQRKHGVIIITVSSVQQLAASVSVRDCCLVQKKAEYTSCLVLAGKKLQSTVT